MDRQPTDLVGLADESVAAFQPQAQAAGVTLAVDAADRFPRVPVDAARIRQVLANLLSNAVRHTPPGGRVTIEVRAAADDDQVEVRVTDTGSGIPHELLPTVFERFVKERGSSGSGLGLAIARDLVEAHGGTIGATSEPGRGTVVAFRLPA